MNQDYEEGLDENETLLFVRYPPSTTKLWPEIYCESSLAKKRAAFAIPSGVNFTPAILEKFSSSTIFFNCSSLKSGYITLQNSQSTGELGKAPELIK
jgi:hypothetical protein